MSLRRSLVEGFLVAAGLSVLFSWSIVTVRQSLIVQSELGRQRLVKSIETMIVEAHKKKDDLTIQQAIHALGEAPGIYFAGVAGKNGTFLAHSQPSLLGKIFHRSRLPVAIYPLCEGPDLWGTMIFALSDSSVHQGVIQQGLVSVFAALFLWVAWMIRNLNWKKQLAELANQKSDLVKIVNENQTNLEKLNRLCQETQQLWSSRLQESVNRIPQGYIFLDHNQRIAALNAPAARCLGITNVKDALGKSWLDIPALQPCGTTLEKSLTDPGQTVEWPLSDRGRLLFETARNGQSGTWVSVSVE